MEPVWEFPIVRIDQANLNQIAQTIKDSATFAELVKNWKSFARSLLIDETEIEILDRKTRRDEGELKEVARELLNRWLSPNGNQTTLNSLCEALRTVQMINIAETLEDNFFPPKPSEIVVVLRDQQFQLSEFLGRNAPTNNDMYQQIIQELLSTTQPPYSKPFHINIFKENFCPHATPEYYIPRMFSHRIELKVDVFTTDSTQNHIFLLSGISVDTFAKVVEYSPIEVSGNQLDKVTVQFVIDTGNDFQRICKVTEKPVHLIECRNELFFWRQSNKGIDVLHSFLKKGGKSLEERQMISKITNSSAPSAFCIADTPGMGKTVALRNLAAKIKECNPTDTVLFIELQQFSQSLFKTDSSREAVDAISSYVTPTKLGKIVMEDLLLNELNKGSPSSGVIARFRRVFQHSKCCGYLNLRS